MAEEGRGVVFYPLLFRYGFGNLIFSGRLRLRWGWGWGVSGVYDVEPHRLRRWLLFFLFILFRGDGGAFGSG